MTDDEKQKVLLEYPCRWVFKIIGPDAEAMKCAVAEIIRDKEYKLSLSRSSKTAKYYSLNVELSVDCEETRLALYDTLKSHRAVKLVL
ncbi:MAG: DUF493 domain-containing protein [Deltaproteobacteria bacterium HGW-Deltaproteobacteria-10]|nr:MAG: DUF493 domain-containing protein [Deltaproteobacteria bacterium HGW-Deltaproteobacteria-10]